MRQIQLANLTTPRCKQIAKRGQVCHPLPGCYRSTYRCIDCSKPLNALRPTRLLKEIQSKRFQHLGKLHSHRRRWTSMTIHHDVHRIPHRLSHRCYTSFRSLERFQTLHRHRRRNRHRLECAKPLRDCLERKLPEPLGIVDRRLVETLHVPTT